MIKKIKCETCKALNKKNNLFCKKCTRYLSSAATYRLDSKEFNIYITALYKIFKKISYKKTNKNNLYFKELLSLFWLRPETAILYAMESIHIKKYFKPSYKIGDIGCGNGLYISYLKGSKFKKKFDAFNNIDLKNIDYYNLIKSNQKI